MTQCEGYHRTGGAFSLGPVTWSQCSNEATVFLTFVQESKTESMSACHDCWKSGIDSNTIEILEVKPIMTNENIRKE